MAPTMLSFALFAVGDYGHSFQFGGFADQFDDDILSGAHRNLLRFITQVGDHDHIGRSDLLSVKLPSLPVITPRVLPLTVTVAPGTPALVSSNT